MAGLTTPRAATTWPSRHCANSTWPSASRARPRNNGRPRKSHAEFWKNPDRILRKRHSHIKLDSNLSPCLYRYGHPLTYRTDCGAYPAPFCMARPSLSVSVARRASISVAAVRRLSTVSGCAFSWEPLSNGGCGSYSTNSWIWRAVASP